MTVEFSFNYAGFYNICCLLVKNLVVFYCSTTLFLLELNVNLVFYFHCGVVDLSIIQIDKASSAKIATVISEELLFFQNPNETLIHTFRQASDTKHSQARLLLFFRLTFVCCSSFFVPFISSGAVSRRSVLRIWNQNGNGEQKCKNSRW